MRIVLVAALAAAFAPLAAADDPGVVVAMALNVFAPAGAVVPLGTPVTFVSAVSDHYVATGGYDVLTLSGQPNDIASTDGDPDTFGVFVGMGDSWTHTFTKPGSYPFYCVVHETLGMFGAVEVVD